MKIKTVVMLLLLLMVMTVKAQEETPTATVEVVLAVVDPFEVTGDITISGSSTVYPVAVVVADQFISEGYGGNISIEEVGTGAGIKRFCEGDVLIATASRKMKPKDEDATSTSEAELCAEYDISVSEFMIGIDALAVVVPNENTFVSCLTLAQLGEIFSGQIATWDKVDSSFPGEAIKVFSPGSDSGTFAYMVERAIQPLFEGEDANAQAQQALLNLPNVQLSENDNILVQGISGNDFSIGYFGFAYLAANRDKLRAVDIDSGNGCITPDEKTTESGEYPLARPLFLYADVTYERNPQIYSFISYFLSVADQALIDVGYFPLSHEALTESKRTLVEAAS